MNKKEFIRNRPFDEVDASEMQQWTEDGIIDYVKSLSTDGVILGLDTVSSTGMKVTVKKGIALDPLYHLLDVDSDQTVNINTAHASLARIDLITLAYKTTTIDNVDSTNKYNRGTSFVYSKNILSGFQIKVYAGTPAASPTVPSVPANEIPLSQVLIPANATTPSTITDRRKRTAMVNAVAPVISNNEPTQNLYDGLWWYKPSNGEWKVYASGQFREINIHNHTISQITGLQNALDAKETPTGAQNKANTAETNAKNASVSKVGDTMSGTLKNTANNFLISKTSGRKSWVFHNSGSNNHIMFAPSNTIDGEDWDWTKQFTLTDVGGLVMPGQLNASNGVFSGTISEAGSSLSSKYVLQTIQIVAGNGLSGGGLLSSNRTLDVIYSGSGGNHGSANTSSRGDHKHDGQYARITGETFTGNIVLDGTHYELKQPDTTSSWARGVHYRKRTDNLVNGGYGYYGSGTGDSQYFYAGFGESPWDINNGLTVARNGANTIVGTLNATQHFLENGTKISDKYASVNNNISAGTGLSGGGTLASNRTLSFDTTWGDNRYLNRTTGGQILGKLLIAAGGNALDLKAGDTSDHVYISLYTDSQAQTTRSGFIGYGSAGVGNLTISNEMESGSIDFSTRGGGQLRFNNNRVLTIADAGSGKGLDADTVDGIHASTFATKATSISAGNGLTGGGDLTANRSLSVNFGGNGSAITVSRSDHNHDNITGTLNNLKTSDKTNLVNALNEVNDEYNRYLSDFDDSDVAKTVEWKRPNNTLYRRSTLSNPDTNGNYQTQTIRIYGTDGTTLLYTEVWTHTYNASGVKTSEVKA